MTRHVSPEQWADVLAGRVAEDERATLEAHAVECDRCARERARIARASDTFSALREQPAPELPWDEVRARVQWAVEKERRDAARTGSQPAIALPRRSRWVIAIPVIAAAGVGLVLGVHRLVSDPAPAPTVATPAPLPSPAPAPAPTPAPMSDPAPAPGTPLTAVVVNARGAAKTIAIDGVLGADVMQRTIGQGDVFATGDDNRIDVQFGPGSAFALGPQSTLELRAFDDRRIELRLDGTLDVEVGPRAAEQRFIVVAGEHTVEVRGTQFQVQRDRAGLTVACRHGKVVVRDRSVEVEVGAARRIVIPAGVSLDADAVTPLAVAQLAELEAATPQQLESWPADPANLIAERIAQAEQRKQAARTADVSAGAVSARRRELREGIDHARLAVCTRSLAKSGLTNTYVQIELTVSASGAVGYLNVVDTDLPTATAACVRGVLADIRFGAGGAATWRERIDL